MEHMQSSAMKKDWESEQASTRAYVDAMLFEAETDIANGAVGDGEKFFKRMKGKYGFQICDNRKN